ncbi:hypothetical protein FAUST_5796 [Fusarium austroamericanum]|uniref:Low-affinity potassium transport protein n=1 Tax=Fusarium austroamericanum TaxID=282268 RepID=A0AAN6HEY9_FUSAU|nr:hypothetical protein FAUST_5796 [Fusarium austroamericanum]
MGLIALPILYPYGNMSAIDAWFFGASSSTESGLNTIDVKELKTYQQLYIYFIPILTNLGFINIIVVIVRLHWFKRHLKCLAPQMLDSEHNNDVEDACNESNLKIDTAGKSTTDGPSIATGTPNGTIDPNDKQPNQERLATRATTISFDVSTEAHTQETQLYKIRPVSSATSNNASSSIRRRRLSNDGIQITTSKSIDRVASVAASLLLLGSETAPRLRSVNSTSIQQPALNDIPQLSRQATIGRNSHFKNLTEHDREVLGGIEYRTLKLLLKIVTCYFFGLHLFGAICLVGWIHTADSKYTDVLDAAAQDKTWGFYSAQSMTDNLGFTLTPDSMISFRDAKWPMILMSFLAFAGNTLYPVFLRLTIWIMSKITPKTSPTQESLTFLLNHPRRCYTLLFPSGPTWILFSIIFALNFIDILLIILLDLKNAEVESLPLSARIPAAIFQAASARHTGTASFNLANVSPAVQLSLLIMMYIAVFPIAISIRASNAYEEKSLGLWDHEESLNEQNGKSYLLTHMKNQLGFDLWYIFLGTFCICIAEQTRIADVKDPAFSVFSILFEVTSAYGNVGLSLGYPTVSFSLCGMFGVFGKVVICFMMIRGRHRGLPYALDRAIMLPSSQSPEKSR